jgi:hypothetical protein
MEVFTEVSSERLRGDLPADVGRIAAIRSRAGLSTPSSAVRENNRERHSCKPAGKSGTDTDFRKSVSVPED